MGYVSCSVFGPSLIIDGGVSFDTSCVRDNFSLLLPCIDHFSFALVWIVETSHEQHIYCIVEGLSHCIVVSFVSACTVIIARSFFRQPINRHPIQHGAFVLNYSKLFRAPKRQIPWNKS